MARMKQLAEAIDILDGMIKDMKIAGDFIGYKSLKELKEDALLGDSKALDRVMSLVEYDNNILVNVGGYYTNYMI
jgi:hypothetical protein